MITVKTSERDDLIRRIQNIHCHLVAQADAEAFLTARDSLVAKGCVVEAAVIFQFLVCILGEQRRIDIELIAGLPDHDLVEEQ